MTKQAFTKLVEASGVAVGKARDFSQKVGSAIANQRHLQKGREYWHMLGPGLTTGAADDDPSGIATYSQAGAQYGFQLLWLASFTFPLMVVVQEMCARIGLVTGQGLAGNIRDHFPRWVLYVCTILLLVANTLNIGADLGAMAKATQLINENLNFTSLLLGFTLFSLALQIITPYERYAKYLKWLVLFLFAYIVSALSVQLDWKGLLWHSVIPSITFSRAQVFMVCAILGTTISPYLFFWQTSQEVEEGIAREKHNQALPQQLLRREISNMRFDVWSGMLLSNVVMFFIIAASGAALYAHGITNIATAADAALALQPFAGDNAYLLFALGIIGTGLLAIPVLAGAASYALSESFGWQFGLRHQLKEAKAFYGIIIVSMVVGFALNFIGFDPMKALLYAAIVNGLIAPIILVLIVLIASNKNIMKERVNSKGAKGFGWFVVAVMTLASVATLIALLLPPNINFRLSSQKMLGSAVGHFFSFSTTVKQP